MHMHLGMVEKCDLHKLHLHTKLIHLLYLVQVQPKIY